MSRLTVTEKEHWKSRIENRINKAIDALEAQDATLMSSLAAKAELQAYEHLGVLEHHQKIDTKRKQREILEEEIKQLESSMCKIALGEDTLRRGDYHRRNDFTIVLRKHSDRFESQLLKESAIGRDILKLRNEKDALLDTVWLATSNAQIRDLWSRVSEVLDDDATPLQRQILASETEVNSNS